LPGFSRCRPSSRVADPGPEAKVSHHFMLLGSKMMPLPSLKLCHRMCGSNPEPNSCPVLSPANNSSNPEALESRGRPIQGPADAQFLPRPRVQPPQMGLADALLLPRPRVLPQQVGHAEVMPGQAQNLPGSRTSRPLEGPSNGSPDAPGHPQQVGVAEVVPGEAQNLPGPCTSEPRVQPQQKGLADDLGQSRLQQMSPHLPA